MLSLTGPVAEVAAVCGTTGLHRMETEDFAGAGLRFANGALGALFATTAAYPGFPERIELIGTEATAVLFAGSLTVHHHDGRVERIGAEQATGAGADPMAFPHDAYRALLADFLDALDQDRAPRLRPRGAQGAASHRRGPAVLAGTPRGGRRRGLIRSLPVADHPPLTFAAIGLDHRHIYHQVGRLLDLGARCAGYHARDTAVPLEGFVRRFPDLRRVAEPRVLLEDPAVQLIVCAAIPGERAEIAIRAMRHGKDVMVDKPGVITADQLDAVRAVQQDTGGSGRSTSPSASRCGR